jgi:hypothetical protein
MLIFLRDNSVIGLPHICNVFKIYKKIRVFLIDDRLDFLESSNQFCSHFLFRISPIR